MLSQEEWTRNVGSDAYPVSFLHEYAVGLIWDMLTARNDGRVESEGHKTEGGRREGDGKVQLPLLDGTLSEDVMAGVEHVVIPDSLQAIGGYIPDLALLDADLKAVRVVEVIVTSHPSAEKVKSLQQRGVEVIQVPVRTKVELEALFPAPFESGIRWWHKMDRRERGLGVSSRARNPLGRQGSADDAMKQLMGNLRICSPEVRRQYVQLLDEMGTLESLYPIRPDNPKSGVFRK